MKIGASSTPVGDRHDLVGLQSTVVRAHRDAHARGALEVEGRGVDDRDRAVGVDREGIGVSPAQAVDDVLVRGAALAVVGVDVADDGPGRAVLGDGEGTRDAEERRPVVVVGDLYGDLLVRLERAVARIDREAEAGACLEVERRGIGNRDRAVRPDGERTVGVAGDDAVGDFSSAAPPSPSLASTSPTRVPAPLFSVTLKGPRP